MDRGLGYDPTLEAQHAATIATMPRIVCATAGEIPPAVDPRGALRCNDQGRRNACCGNARDKVVELCQWLETGVADNLSARFAYLTTKIVDGTIAGGDRGASISGAALASMRYGECEESLFPYWRDDEPYSTEIPQEAMDQGAAHRLKTSEPSPDWNHGRNWIGRGAGGILFGIPWTARLHNFRGRTLTVDFLGGSYMGEHALCLIGYMADGRGIMANSHGPEWGTEGFAQVDPSVLDRWYRTSQHGFRAFSDLPHFRERVFQGWKGMFG